MSGPVAGAPQPDAAARLRERALRYLGRYAASRRQLERVLLRRALRELAVPDRDVEAAVRARIISLAAELERDGLLDDRSYALQRVRRLVAAGQAPARIRAGLRAKGVADAALQAATAELRAETGDLELAAAIAYARRRRLGPWGPRPIGQRQDDLARLARAGFGVAVAKRIVAAGTADELTAELDPSSRQGR